MNRDEQIQLLSEQTALRKILDSIPVDDILNRTSLNARLSDIEKRLAPTVPDIRAPALVRLTFRGEPVIGSHGIFAEFAMAAITVFTRTAALVAANLAGPLKTGRRIPHCNQSQLLITSTAIGSFGFELEEHSEQPLLLDDESVVRQALARTQELLKSTTGSDDDLTDAVAGVDLRVIGAVRRFLKILVQNNATCALEQGKQQFAFRDVAQVRRSMERLAKDNVHEETKIFTGEFQGVLPKRRTFEFRVSGEETVITGRIGSEIEDPDELNSNLHIKTEISLVATRLGSGRPLYVLKQKPVWDMSAVGKTEVAPVTGIASV